MCGIFHVKTQLHIKGKGLEDFNNIFCLNFKVGGSQKKELEKSKCVQQR